MLSSVNSVELQCFSKEYFFYGFSSRAIVWCFSLPGTSLEFSSR